MHPRRMRLPAVSEADKAARRKEEELCGRWQELEAAADKAKAQAAPNDYLAALQARLLAEERVGE